MPSPTITHFLLFEVSRNRFALPVDAVREVLPMVALAQVSGAPRFVAGYLDVFPDEPPLPVLRLDALLDLPRDDAVPGTNTPLVVCRKTDDPPAVALIARRVEGIISASPSPLSEDAATFNGCVTGLVGSGEGESAALVLSLPGLLLEEEKARLRLFARIAAERRAAVRDPGEEAESNQLSTSGEVR